MSEDTTQRRVRALLLGGAAEAYGLRFPSEPVCVCGDGLSAHHGERGEGRCGEAGCPCQRFEERSNDGDD